MNGGVPAQPRIGFRTRYDKAATRPDAGSVNTQATPILRATLQWTALKRSDEPAPRIALEMIQVPEGVLPARHLARISFDGSDDDPAEVARVLGVTPGHRNAKMEMQPGVVLDISFSDRKRPMTIFDLREIGATVQEIVDRFAPEIG